MVKKELASPLMKTDESGLSISDVHGTKSERWTKFALVFVALVVPLCTVILTLVPPGITEEKGFYDNASPGIVTAFWVLIMVSMIKTNLFLIKLNHVWGLEFLADEVRTSNILIQWSGGINKNRWKNTVSDLVSLAFYGGCAIELFLEGETTAALALGLQMCFTMRNSLELQLQRPSQQAQRLPQPKDEVIVISEALLSEILADMHSSEDKYKDFSRDNLVAEIKKRRYDGWEGIGEEGEGMFWEKWVQHWRFKLGDRKKYWEEYWCTIIFGKVVRLNPAFGWGIDRSLRRKKVEVGKMHEDWCEVVMPRMTMLYFTCALLQNGQLLMYAAIALNSLSGASADTSS
mmetsp:Transcript_20032/g.41910  ORF Transcript_20032/g.41910 Transcript_20032/m.41910 type:complete len:346 (-) Transcript_20032:36-1073(-)